MLESKAMRFFAVVLILMGFLGSQSYQMLCGSACLGQYLWGVEDVETQRAQASCHEELSQNEPDQASAELSKLECFHSISVTARQTQLDELSQVLIGQVISFPSIALQAQSWVLTSQTPQFLGPPLYLRFESLII